MCRDYMTIAMTVTLKEVSSMYNVVRDSWELIQERKSSIEMGALVFDYLFSLVPNVAMIFTKSRQEMAIKMGNMLDMIITCAEVPDHMKKQLESLGLRHVVYSVKPHHIPLMGPVLISVLSDQLGADWTPEIEQAWTSLWAVIGETMAQAIQDGLDYGVPAGKILNEIQERAEPHRVGHLILTALSSSAPDLVDSFCKDPVDIPDTGASLAQNSKQTRGTSLDRQTERERESERETKTLLQSAQAHADTAPSEPAAVLKAGSAWKTVQVHVKEHHDASVSVEHAAGVEASRTPSSVSSKPASITPLGASKSASSTQPLAKALKPGFMQVIELAMKNRVRRRYGGATAAADKYRGKEGKDASGQGKKDPANMRQRQLHVEGETTREKQKRERECREQEERLREESTQHDERAETVGFELWAFVLKAAELMFEPEKQNELIFVYANRYFRRGMRQRHLPMVGNAIEAVFAIILQGDEWTHERRYCWVWLWNNISITLGKVICIVCICIVHTYIHFIVRWAR
jgi:hemoglobin-like flavoprotein